MTPGEMRDELSALQERISDLELVALRQKDANVVYISVGHEMVEAWDALQRGVEQLDEAIMGVT